MTSLPDETALSDEEIDVTPTRALFVEMLTRDIQLDRAVLDLVDNSIDGAKRLRPGNDSSFDGLEISIVLNDQKFEIRDNCGGIGIETARKYAFRFGRAKGMQATPGSVGQFGVGMKRALFKFGHRFEVKSSTTFDSFNLEVDVDAWEQEPGPWRFAFSSSETNVTRPEEDTGTHITVSPLRNDARAQFSSLTFRNMLGRQIEAAQQQYIDRGLRIIFDGKTLLATPWKLIRGQGIEPSYQESVIPTEGGEIKRRIYAGLGPSSPQEAGWYVFCNGRMILTADQSRTTGWERDTSDEGVTMPKFHGQFARFRGYVFLDAVDSSLLPWNTTKTGVDTDTDAWRNTYAEMQRAMRPVIDFLNKLAAENDRPQTDRPFTEAVSKSSLLAIRSLTRVGPFVNPQPPAGPKPVPWTSIQFSRPKPQVDELKKFYDASSNSDLGGILFDEAFKKSVSS
ncbi:hypothetical protein GOC87_03785 [Sinorhizobium meliloti]|uniref:ATP-binding protein n=1 Tax=Rhizobium meliloti TaxID=382 RepID=UPI000B49A290|nr:ATP-binding protein [Sinorhizobium meliloti]ASQ02363.1 hypothetical protein CDO24_34960 [Sinorhizobium meliloti]MDW9702778.1 hypothetical protein [Sinorhizobium meliloti]MDW9932944.1 hypothetical protein [Sinorhizobium meliloti]MDX0098723.1 hypothetical protein [Sinorhizobium meliloti]MDX0117374.1 hypothetical protein [Sinorhizobium meliloti]